MAVYYNENDPFAAAWLRELIGAGHIAKGEVDERSIVEVEPGDLRGFNQCHFFAGIGGWSYALRLAGWPDDRAVWTGSCPCQPFSSAGKRKHGADERHLWPEFHRLIGEHHPPVVFGEQVASDLGREWLARVRADLEALEYAVGAADLCAAGVGAPHIRQRLHWMADAGQERHDGSGTRGAGWNEPADCSNTSGLADTDGGHQSDRGLQRSGEQRQQSANGWACAEWLPCLDGKARRSEPGIFPVVDGFPGSRVGVLRGAGNAIVPPVAARFIEASEAARRSRSGLRL